MKTPSTKPPIKVSPSILSADLLNLNCELRAAEAAGADFHHVDVMDGHFVPNLTFGLPLVEAARKMAQIPLDVHIMISNPDEYAVKYVEAGAYFLSFHLEVARDPKKIINDIKSAGGKAGVAVNPGTDIKTVWPYLSELSIVNVMSVNPGFSGQKFMEVAVEKVALLWRELEERGLEDKVLIEVDGGINEETGRRVRNAGASVLVAGNFVYKAGNRVASIQMLKSL